MTREDFAARLRELRDEKGWTQAELAERAGVSAIGVAQWERAIREPGLLKAVALAEALGISLDAFRQPVSQPQPAKKAGRPHKKR